MANIGALRIWLGWVVFFFAWAFVIHGTGLLLHEVGGHGVAGTILGCGIDRFDLTYFGHGLTFLTPCPSWTWARRALVDWAGLVVTIGAGVAAIAFQRRAGLAPLTRLLLALLATCFLLGELEYATAGGFHDLYDPALVAVWLGARGLHILAWLPPLVLFAASALYGARTIVDAFREHFGTHSRLHTLRQITTTFGAAGILYFLGFHLEQTIRTVTLPRVVVRAEQLAAARGQAPPFPIERVLFAIAVVAFVAALARPAVRGDGAQGSAPSMIPRRHAVSVAVAALVCFIAITLLARVRAARAGI